MAAPGYCVFELSDTSAGDDVGFTETGVNMAEVKDEPKVADPVQGEESAPPVAPPKNYLVKCTAFGKYKQGDVIPRYVARQSGDVDFHIRDNNLAETEAEVNTAVLVGPTPTNLEVDAVAQANKHRQEADKYKQLYELAAGEAAALKQKLKDLEGELGRQVAENARLNGLLKPATASASPVKATESKPPVPASPEPPPPPMGGPKK